MPDTKPDAAPAPQALRVVAGTEAQEPRQTGQSKRERGKKAQRDAAREAARQAEIEREIERIRQQWGLDDLDEVDRKMLAIKLTQPGISDRELGLLVGLKNTATNVRVNRAAFKRALEDSQLSALAIIARAQTKAAKQLEKALDSPNEEIALRAATEIMRPTLRKAQLGGTSLDAFDQFLRDVAGEPGAPTAPDDSRKRA